MPAPAIDTLSTNVGRPGEPLTIRGQGFGPQRDPAQVLFHLQASGALEAGAPVTDWKNQEITARVPDLAALGSGGIADVWVRTRDGESRRLPFAVLEPAPPAITRVVPQEGLSGSAVLISGSRFGMAPFGPAAALFTSPSGGRMVAAADSWSPTEIRVRVPEPQPLGGAGTIALHVTTLWGESGAVPFTIAGPPVVTSVAPAWRPDEPASGLPGDVLVVRGTSFGPGAGPDTRIELVSSQDSQEPTISMEIVSWGPTEIRLAVPYSEELGPPGRRQLVVRTRWGESAPVAFELEGPPSLDPAPIALLPLRLETRYAPDGRALWVRAVPDDIHVDTHEPDLTVEEHTMGTEFLAAGPGSAEAAWRRLVSGFGPNRAAWIVEALRAGGSQVREQPWNRAARTRVLPRRLFAFAYRGGADEPFATAWGRPIPFELPLGPDPSSPPEVGELPLDEGMRWMVDFDAAVDRGMGLKLPLPEPGGQALDRVVVVGVETSLTKHQAATELGDALRAHRFTGGIGFVPEGTPTNRTPPVPGELAPDVPPVPPPTAPAVPPGSHVDVTARALGLGQAAAPVFAGLAHAHEGSALRAARGNMNAALWPTTWGYFLDHMMAPELSEAADAGAVTQARHHFADWVRAASLPVLRVGDQPYGLVAVTPLGHWTAEPGEPAGLARLLDGVLRQVWRDSVKNVPRISDEPAGGAAGGTGGPELSEHPLLSALSMQPTSISYRARSVLGASFVDAAWRFMRTTLADLDPPLDMPPAWWQQHAELVRQALDAFGLDWTPNLERTVFASDYFPVPSPLVRTGGGAAPLAPDWIAQLNGMGWQQLRDETIDLPAPRPLLYLLLRSSLLHAYLVAAGEMSPTDRWWGGEIEIYGVDEIDDDLDAPRPPMTWDRLDQRVSPDGPTKGQVLDGRPQGQLAAVRQSVAGLVGLPVETLERAAAETLDLCSHRLDAWMTSFASRRLAALRSRPGGEDGVHIGAYGFVENLAPGEPRDSAGYLHTPSPAHAAAAAILASGYRSHPANPQGRHPFGVDLSSERVRISLSLLDGVRSGHSLGALLGYRFERGLQDRGLGRFLNGFRAIAPLGGAGTTPGSGAMESIAAQNVVDGLALHRLWVGNRRQVDDQWTAGQAAGAAQAELEALDDDIDALGDVFLTEAVYQTVRGNPARVAAALDAAANPAGPPPEIEVVSTPHAGLGVTHRLLVLLPELPAAAAGWEPDPAFQRRALAEPRLNGWAARLLGDPKRVRFRVKYRHPQTEEVLAEREMRLDQLQPALSPIDVVYAAVANERAQRSEIEERIAYTAIRTRPETVPPDAQVVVDASRQPELEHKVGLMELFELAQAMREVLSGARPVQPGDLSRPEAANAAVVDADELRARAIAAVDQLRAASAELDAALQPGVTSEPLRAALLRAAGFGVPGAVPLSAFGDTAEDRDDLRVQGSAVHADVARRLRVMDSPAVTVADALAYLQAVFGPAFRALPVLSLPSAPDPDQLDPSFSASSSLLAGDPFALSTWFQQLCRVRDGARRLGDVLLYADMLGGTDTYRFVVAQLPAVSADRWVGLPLVEGRVPTGRVSVVGLLPLGPPRPAPSDPPTTRLVGLHVDELTEVLPSPQRTTGLSFHYDQPNATAPHAIVLAVPPRPEEEWTLEQLVATVSEALELARFRMVDLPAMEHTGQFLPALYFPLNFKGVTVGTNFKAGIGQVLG